MEQKSIAQLITEYLDLLRRGKYFIIVPFLVCTFLGTAIAFKLPKVYRSEAKMFYIEAQVPDWAKLETVNIYLEAMLIFIEATALNPDNVLRLITELDLYPELKDRVPNSEMINFFKNNYEMKYDYTQVPNKYGQDEEFITGFTFHFDHTDAKKSYYVANAFATQFIELYRKFREKFSGKTSIFFESERERIRREISSIDQRISIFKQKHVNELPELFQFNYGLVERITQKIFNIDEKLMTLQDRKMSLETQLNVTNPALGMTGISGDRIVSPQERLTALRAELGQLRARYSERHPDVRRTQNEIAKLEALIKEKGGHDLSDGGQGDRGRLNKIESAVMDQSGAFNPAYLQITMQLDELKAEMANLQRLRSEAEKERVEYERRVGVTPLVETEWLILQRDRDSAQKRFDDLASQVLTMESAAEMEKKELGGKLSIGKPPEMPLKSVKPNVGLIIALSAVVGLLIGLGLLFGWDFVTKTVRTPQDITGLFQTAVLAELPLIDVQQNASIFRFNKATLRLAVVIVLIAVVVAVDLFYMKIDVLIVKVLTSIQTALALTGL